jgi:hypothetical protein
MTGEFHVHVDAWELSPQFAALLRDELQFTPSYFAGHPDGEDGFEPPHHLTFKTRSSPAFKLMFETVAEAAKAPGAMRGYVEGEFLPIDEDIPAAPFRPEVPVPVRRLNLGSLPEGAFRESEIHIVMSSERSDPRLLEVLTDMGLFSAYMEKPYGRAIIFTAGGGREIVGQLLSSLRDYLREAGGGEEASIKEERIAAFWVSDTSLRLPPVVTSIDR